MNLLDNLVKDLLDRIKFSELCAESDRKDISEYGGDQMGMILYFKQCQKEQKLALPILQKIFEKKLILRDYTINEGVCKAIRDALEKDPDLMQDFVVENCGIQDHACSILMEGMNNLHHCHSVVLKNQEIGEHTVQKLADLLANSFPYQLKELRLINCKLKAKDTDKLMEILLKNSFLRRLVLTQANFNEASLLKFCDFIQMNNYIRQVNLSWNQMIPKQYGPLLDCLAGSSLQEINLSHNQLLSSEEDTNEAEELLIEQLKAIVRIQTLMHLHLNNCSLNENVLVSIMVSILQSPSILSAHLSNNEGLKMLEDRGKTK